MMKIWIKRFFDILFPRICINCGKVLSISEDAFCVGCMLGISRTYFHLNPLENDMVKRFYSLLPIEKATAWMFYSPEAYHSRFIHHLKYNNRPDIAETAGRIMAAEIRESGFFDGIDLLVPVPLTPKRKRHRGYNQSEYIAKGINSITSIPVNNKVLRRKHFQKSQTHLNYFERQENVRNAFELIDAEAIRGKHVMLVDDIVTHGTTATECGKELMKAGDVKISVISLGFTK